MSSTAQNNNGGRSGASPSAIASHEARGMASIDPYFDFRSRPVVDYPDPLELLLRDPTPHSSPSLFDREFAVSAFLALCAILPIAIVLFVIWIFQ